jgi:hypothetical protein
MKKLLLLILCVLTLLAMTACIEQDPNDNHVTGYKLDQFVSADSVRVHVDSTAAAGTDFRSLYAYEIVSGDDGFSPRLSANAGYDIIWETFSNGYLVPEDEMRTWFPETSLPGAFKVKETGLFRLYRKVDVNDGAKGSKMVELNGLIKYPTTNWSSGTEDAIKLSDLVQGIAAYDSVAFVAADGYSKTYTPELVNDGYYLLNSEITTFPSFNASLPGSMKKFKKLASIQVYGATSAQTYDFDLALTETADMVFEVPNDLTSFTGTELDTE